MLCGLRRIDWAIARCMEPLQNLNSAMTPTAGVRRTVDFGISSPRRCARPETPYHRSRTVDASRTGGLIHLKEIKARTPSPHAEFSCISGRGSSGAGCPSPSSIGDPAWSIGHVGDSAELTSGSAMPCFGNSRTVIIGSEPPRHTRQRRLLRDPYWNARKPCFIAAPRWSIVSLGTS